MKLLTTVLLLCVSFSSYARYCATVYQGNDFSGADMVLYEGDRLSNLNDYYLNNYSYKDWDNKVSSAKIASGCKLVMFQYQNFGHGWNTEYRQGKKLVLANKREMRIKNVPYLGSFNNLASSLKCKCRR